MPLTKDDHLYLVDGSGFIFRAYHALPSLTRKSDGLPVGAISGFCNMMWKLVDEAKDEAGGAATHLAVIFDHSSKTFRNDIYPEYKANRSEPPDDLRPQFPLIRDAVRAFSLPSVEMPGFEADDLIATYARQASAAGATVTIVSSDKDLMQLIDDNVSMYDGMKSKAIGAEQVHEKFGVGPERVIDVQALAGDSTDNVPGAPGIGVKTAALLINEYGDLETLLARAEEIKQPKRRQTLIENAEQIRVSRELVTLKDDIADVEAVEGFALSPPDPAKLLEFLNLMEFSTLTNRVATNYGAAVPEVKRPKAAKKKAVSAAGGLSTQPDPKLFEKVDPASYETVSDAAALAKWIDLITERGWVAVDTETNSLDGMQAELVGVSLCVEPGEACYIPLAHVTGDGDLLGAAERAEGQVPMEEALKLLKPVLEDPSILKIGQNLKYDMKVLHRYGIAVAPIDDTMLIAYAQGAGGGDVGTFGMDALAGTHLDIEPIKIKELIGTGKAQITFDKVAIDKAAPYAAEDADVTLRLWQLLKPGLAPRRATTVYETLERPLIPVLARMEMEGIKVDRDALSRMSNGFSQKMAGLEAEIHELAGESFNVGSPKQLGEILFDKMGLEGGKKSKKTGAYATGADVLEDLAILHDLPQRVLEWRQLSKLKSTYTDSLQSHINPETGRVHTSFSMAATSTGRLASTEPNLQNIPVRTEEGRAIRHTFVAEKGNVLVSLDYSQIELRILAHIAQIDALKQAFDEGKDIHAATASAMFGVPMDEMTPSIRRQAKAINFGVIYGISAFGLARNLRIPRGEAKDFIDTYFEQFPGIRAYMEEMKERARAEGYVETLFGRRIHTPNINAKGPQRSYQERAAINAPIQGTAADIIRRAMIRMPEALSKAKLSSRMLLQVHDELVFEAPEAEADALIDVARDVMENAAAPVVELTTPLVVEGGKGASWGEAH